MNMGGGRKRYIDPEQRYNQHGSYKWKEKILPLERWVVCEHLDVSCANRVEGKCLNLLCVYEQDQKKPTRRF